MLIVFKIIHIIIIIHFYNRNNRIVLKLHDP